MLPTERRLLGLAVQLKASFSCLLCSLLLYGCNGRDCTDIGCFDGLIFEFSPPLTAEGVVTITVSGDTNITCSQDVSDASGPCKDAGVVFTLDYNRQLTALSLWGFYPQSVALTVSSEGTVLREMSASVTYEEEQPNGPGCEPICRSATVVVGAP